MKQSESFNRVPNVSNEVGKRSQIHCYNCQQQGHKSYECKAKIRNSKPKNFNYTKGLKTPTTHTVQDLPPNPWLRSCIAFQLIIDCVKQVVVQKGRNLINFSSSEGRDLSLHINPENKVKKKEKVNKDEIDVVKNRTRENNVLKFSNISETDSDNGCTRCQIEVEDNSETKDFGENFKTKEICNFK
ncbi:hypothetical protein TNIN_413651 [Trichonephila inaurata madagascariensis]|uniref:CCHC-type domain-containing protein n=1 Tax=Trichonephila inaurata madagascariensis TaxID=2747483 RepID=A0A8X7C6X7_9ARAC|nr:hypothetical protein TNIN_413651 [Trichonephila inaurata madagascariensis]